MRRGRIGLAMLLVLAGCDSPKDVLQADELHRAARDTASIAREGALLVDQIQRGSVGTDYVWVHQQALQEETQRAAQPLHKPAPETLRAQQQQVEAVNASVSSALERAPLAQAGPDELTRLARAFAQAGEQAAALKGDKSTSANSPWAS